MQVVRHRCLAASIGARDGDQRGIAGDLFDVERDRVAPEPAPDALEGV